MNISELIKRLEEIRREQGEVTVHLQYQDDGGCYQGHTNGIEFFNIDKDCEDKTILVLE